MMVSLTDRRVSEREKSVKRVRKRKKRVRQIVRHKKWKESKKRQ